MKDSSTYLGVKGLRGLRDIQYYVDFIVFMHVCICMSVDQSAL